MLGAVVASVNQRHTKVNEFVELAVEGSAHTGVERQEIFEHLRAMGQRLLRVAGLAAKRLFVDFLDFGARLLGTDQADTRHRILQGCE